MKTAISIPDEIFESAEKLGKRMGLSRSRLYSTAIRQFVQARDGSEIRSRINEVCRDVDTSVDPAIERIQSRALKKYSEW